MLKPTPGAKPLAPAPPDSPRDPLAPRQRAMISFWISVVPPKLDWTRLICQSSTFAAESNGLVFPPVKAGSTRSARAAAFARGDLGGDYPPWDRLAELQLPEPRRGPDNHAEPAAADIPAAGADVDSVVSSPRRSCHRSSRCTMPATAARWGRAPASRRAAISTSAAVRTLTTPAWARAALDDHRGSETVVRRVELPSGQRPLQPAPRFRFDPAAFAAAASRAAPGMNASVLSAHAGGEIICVICVAAPSRPSAVAVAVAVVAGALKAEDPVPSPSR